MNWFTRLFRKPVTPKVTQINPVVFRATGLEVTEQQWRATPSLVSAAMAMTNDIRWFQMLECLRTCSPENYVLSPAATLQDRAVIQAKIEGWKDCLATIKRLATPPEEPVYVEETFAPENLLEKE